MRLKISLIFFCLIFIGLTSSEVIASPTLILSPKVEKDSIPKIKYNGYRLYLTHFERIKEKKDFLYIKVSAINTGNKRMDLGKGSAQIFPVIKFDESIVSADLNDFQKAIYFKLLDKKVSVPIGAISTNIELKLPLADSEKVLDIEETQIPITATKKEEIKEATVVVEEAPKKEKKKKKAKSKETPLVEVESTKEEIPEIEQKENIATNLSSTKPKEKKKKKKKVKKEKNRKVNPVAENVQEIEPDTGEEFSELTSSTENIIEEEIKVETNLEEVSMEEILPSATIEKEEEVAIENNSETIAEETADIEPIDLSPPTIKEIIAKSAAEGCSDLVFKNLTILKKNKKSVTVQYELLNQGVGTAHLVLGTKSKQEGLAIRANLSSSERLTRGSIPIESIFLHGDEVSINGGETYTGEVKLSLLKYSKFTPVLILEVDAYEFVPECDETNNKSFVRLAEKVEN